MDTIKINRKIASKINMVDDLKFEGDYFIIDSTVLKLYPELGSLHPCMVVSAGESLKTYSNVLKTADFFVTRGCKRNHTVTVIGGGTVGDMGGFAASIYMRGIRWNNIPTTLLAMVDSGIGGKTGINYCGVKNMLGTFYHPEGVYIYTNFIKTLSDEDFLSGVGEIIKYAFIYDSKLYTILLNNHKAVLSRDIDIMKEIIHICARLKAIVVEEDPYEHGDRIILNAGHTIGHAIESHYDYKVPHGHAIAAGLYYEALLGEKLGITYKGTALNIKEILKLYGFKHEYDLEVLERYITNDKKSTKKGIRIPFVKALGETDIREIMFGDFENII